MHLTLLAYLLEMRLISEYIQAHSTDDVSDMKSEGAEGEPE
jgi:hypothetical protein